MVVAADLNRTVAAVRDRNAYAVASFVQYQLAVLRFDRAGRGIELQRHRLAVTRGGCGDEAAVERELARAAGRDNRMVHRDELGAVWECPLDLHFVDHLGHTVGDVFDAQQLTAEIHELGNRSSVPDELEHLRRDESHGFGMIEAQTARQPFLRQHASLVEEQLVDFARRQMHVRKDCSI